MSRELTSFLGLLDILEEEIPELVAVHILCEVYIYSAQALFLESEPEEYRSPVIVDDRELFHGRIVIETPVDIDTVLIHSDLGHIGSIIFDHEIDSDKYEHDDAQSIELNENPPYDECETKNPSSRIPGWTFCVLGCYIPREHKKMGYKLDMMVLIINQDDTEITKPMIPFVMVSAPFFFSWDVRPKSAIWNAPYMIMTTEMVAANPRMKVVA